MPLYVMKCGNGHRFERVMTIAAMEQGEHRCDCGAAAAVQIVPVAIAPMFTPYQCPITDKPIMSLAEHRENLKKHGCRVLEPGETEQAKCGLVEADRALDRSVEQTTEQFIDGLNGDQRSQLVNEIQSGLDVGFERRTAGN